MPDERNPEIPIVLDRLRHFRFDINAMATFEELTGLNLLQPSVQRQLEKIMSVTQFRAFLYSCLIHEDDTLTLQQVGSFINMTNMEEISNKITEAQRLATVEEGKADQPDPTRTGKTKQQTKKTFPRSARSGPTEGTTSA